MVSGSLFLVRGDPLFHATPSQPLDLHWHDKTPQEA